MDNNGFYNKVRDRAFSYYESRSASHLPGNEVMDWDNALVDQMIEEKIREEAYLHYLAHGGDDLTNWNEAKREIEERINFLAFYIHESNYNQSPILNWHLAKRLYVSQF